MKKMLLVVNPVAGTKKAPKALAKIVSVFNRADYDVTVYITATRGDAARQVAEKAAQMDLVVCCGGDGTFNETITGLMESGANTPLGYIPAGSTNDFAGSLQLPAEPVKAAQQIVDGALCCYDVGRLNDRYFSYVASFGVFTKASYATPQNIKNALGHTAYLLQGISELSQLKTVAVELELDGQTVCGDYLFGAICNSTSVGGILTLDPKQVDMADGRFEVLLVRSPKNLMELQECIQALTTQKYNCRMITFRSAEKVVIRAPADMDWSLDGEWAPGAETLVAENLHHAIRLMKKENG